MLLLSSYVELGIKFTWDLGFDSSKDVQGYPENERLDSLARFDVVMHRQFALIAPLGQLTFGGLHLRLAFAPAPISIETAKAA